VANYMSRSLTTPAQTWKHSQTLTLDRILWGAGSPIFFIQIDSFKQQVVPFPKSRRTSTPEFNFDPQKGVEEFRLGLADLDGVRDRNADHTRGLALLWCNVDLSEPAQKLVVRQVAVAVGVERVEETPHRLLVDVIGDSDLLLLVACGVVLGYKRIDRLAV